MFQFENYPEVGERIFSYLDLKTLLKCSSVCKDWKQVLESPYFWLKKLNEVGQPSEIETAWKNLITKSCGIGIQKSVFTKCLKMKYKDFIIAQDYKDKFQRNVSVYYLQCPPIYTAAYHGFLEIVELIYQFRLDFNRKIYWVPNLHFEKNYYDMPIFTAIANGHTEIVKYFAYILKEMAKPSVDYYGHTPIMYAILLNKLDIVKILVPFIRNVNFLDPRSGQGLIHLSLTNYRIFEYIITLPGIDLSLRTQSQKTPLELLNDKIYKYGHKIPAEDVAKMKEILGRNDPGNCIKKARVEDTSESTKENTENCVIS